MILFTIAGIVFGLGAIISIFSDTEEYPLRIVAIIVAMLLSIGGYCLDCKVDKDTQLTYTREKIIKSIMNSTDPEKFMSNPNNIKPYIISKKSEELICLGDQRTGTKAANYSYSLMFEDNNGNIFYTDMPQKFIQTSTVSKNKYKIYHLSDGNYYKDIILQGK